ncbi:MAG: hypothetical protein F4Z33_09370, partial [Gemmatimonadales bacterium]|nr:hypothetical protein [Gemmatimonadales bacterium]
MVRPQRAVPRRAGGGVHPALSGRERRRITMLLKRQGCAMRAAIFPDSRVLPAGSVLSVLLSVALSTGLDAQESRPMTVEDVLALRSLSQISVSPDGQWVAYVVTERDMEEDRQETDVWVVPATGGPGNARQLTFRPGSDDAPAWH